MKILPRNTMALPSAVKPSRIGLIGASLLAAAIPVKELQPPLAQLTEDKIELSCADDGERPAKGHGHSLERLAEYLGPRVGKITIKPRPIGPAQNGAAVPKVSLSRPIARLHTSGGEGDMSSTFFCTSKNGRTTALTNYHAIQAVLADPTGLEAMVTLPNGETHPAKVLKADFNRDLALLEISGVEGLKTLRLMPAGKKPKLGSPAYTLGHGGGISNSFKAGYFSAIDHTDFDQLGMKNFLRDAAPLHVFTTTTNQGDSGTAVMNEDGEVACLLNGVIPKLIMPLGLCVPASSISEFLAQARNNGAMEARTMNAILGITPLNELEETLSRKRGEDALSTARLEYIAQQIHNPGAQVPEDFPSRSEYIGFLHREQNRIMQTLPDTRRFVAEATKQMEQAQKALGKAPMQGILLVDTDKDPLSERLGLEAGDVITHLNGRPIRNEKELYKGIGAHYVDQPLTITYYRDGKRHRVHDRGQTETAQK